MGNVNQRVDMKIALYVIAKTGLLADYVKSQKVSRRRNPRFIHFFSFYCPVLGSGGGRKT